MKKNFKTCFILFYSSFYISIFIIGGGYVALPLMKKRFVDNLKWLENDEITDLIAISQAAPGAVSINASVALGYKVAGLAGSISSLIGMILPPIIIITIIQSFYDIFISNKYISAFFKGMNCAVAAMMVDIVITMAADVIKSLKYLAVPLMLLSFVLTFFFNVNPVFVVLGSIIVGTVAAFMVKK